MNGQPIMILSPALEAQQLLDDATAVVAHELAQGIAALGYSVGIGIAPHPTACKAAADRICKKFAGAVLAAVQFERALPKIDALRVAMQTQTDLVERLCDAVDREAEDIGGEGSLTIVRMLGTNYTDARKALKQAEEA